MKQKGFIYALYINNTFIEHFDSVDSAKQCAKEATLNGDNPVFVRPIVYFSSKPVSKAPEK